MPKNFNLDAMRIADMIVNKETDLQIGLLSGMIDQTIHHHVTEESAKDEYDKIILRGGKILDKYDPSDKKPLIQKSCDFLYMQHDDSKKFYQKNLDAEVAFLPAISTFKDNIIDFTALVPELPNTPQTEPEEV